MVLLTFEHSRNVFQGEKFKPWIYKVFPSARFDSFKWGQWYPTIKIPFDEFRDNHKNIPETAQRKIAGIKTDTGTGAVELLTFLCHDVRPVNRITNLHPDFEKVTGRECYGKYVEEIIDIN